MNRIDLVVASVAVAFILGLFLALNEYENKKLDCKVTAMVKGYSASEIVVICGGK